MTPSHLTLSDPERSKSRSLIFRSIISGKGAELGHMLLLNISRKAYMGSQLVWLYLILLILKVNFKVTRLISRKRAELGHMLLLNIIRNHIYDAQLHHQFWLWMTFTWSLKVKITQILKSCISKRGALGYMLRTIKHPIGNDVLGVQV